jgi:hypothetical protein
LPTVLDFQPHSSIMPETAEQTIEYFDAKYLDPKYPIVKADPNVDDIVKSMRGSDYRFFAGTMVGSWTYGYLLGKPIRGPTAAMCASAGFTFAMFYTMQTVRSRLLGFRENDTEVNKWGLAPIQPRKYTLPHGRFPARQPMETKAPLNWNNYD